MASDGFFLSMIYPLINFTQRKRNKSFSQSFSKKKVVSEKYYIPKLWKEFLVGFCSGLGSHAPATFVPQRNKHISSKRVITMILLFYIKKSNVFSCKYIKQLNEYSFPFKKCLRKVFGLFWLIFCLLERKKTFTTFYFQFILKLSGVFHWSIGILRESNFLLW